MSDAAVDELVEQLQGSSDSDLDGRVRSLELERRRIEAELALTIGEIDRRRSYLDDGHRSLAAYLRATCNLSDAEAARVDRLADVAAGVPGVVEALHEGHIGTAQANELAVAHANPRVRSRLPEFAALLLDHAERLSFREFRSCVKRFVMLADVDGAHRDLDESVQNRRAHVASIDGSLCLDASGGDPLVNVELEAIFRRFCGLEYDADVANRRAEHGDRAPEFSLPRTPAQRSYDAFVAIMRGALANAEAGRPSSVSEPLVNILIDHRTWARTLADAGLAPDETLAGERVDPFTGVSSPEDLLADLLADPSSIGTRRCETSTGQVLHPHTVLRAALAGHIRRAVLGGGNVPIDLGRTARVFTGPARDAARLLAVQCDHLGCGLPADWCQVDHSTEWSAQGRTDQDNAGVRCGCHNRLKHRKRWRTERDVHGRVHTIRSDGTLMLPVGVRPPAFSDEPVPLPPEVRLAIDEWRTRSPADVERRCRELRGIALLRAVARDEFETWPLIRRVHPSEPGELLEP